MDLMVIAAFPDAEAFIELSGGLKLVFRSKKGKPEIEIAASRNRFLRNEPCVM